MFLLIISKYKISKLTKIDCDRQQKMEHSVFMRWINFVLQSCGRTHLIRNIHSDLSDGLALIEVLECITGKQIDAAHRIVTLHKQRVENITLILQFLEFENVDLMTEICKYITSRTADETHLIGPFGGIADLLIHAFSQINLVRACLELSTF